MRGLGVRVAPQAKALLLPSTAGKGRTAQLLGRRLFWFEGEIFAGPNAERAAVAALAGNDGAPELIMLDAERFMHGTTAWLSSTRRVRGVSRGRQLRAQR